MQQADLSYKGLAPIVLAGAFIVSQIWPLLGRINANIFGWLAKIQRRHSDSLSAAYSAYRLTWKDASESSAGEASINPELGPEHREYWLR